MRYRLKLHDTGLETGGKRVDQSLGSSEWGCSAVVVQIGLMQRKAKEVGINAWSDSCEAHALVKEV
jgi:hypothetical protein